MTKVNFSTTKTLDPTLGTGATPVGGSAPAATPAVADADQKVGITAGQAFSASIKGRDATTVQKEAAALQSLALSLDGLASMLETGAPEAKIAHRAGQLANGLGGASKSVGDIEGPAAGKAAAQLSRFAAATQSYLSGPGGSNAPLAKDLGALAAFAGAAVDQGASVAAKSGVAALRPDREIDFSQLEQIGAQGGSNPGALFKHKETGEKFYVKLAKKGEDMARNEVLSAKLYELAGIDVPELNFINVTGKLGYHQPTEGGEVGIASTIISGDLQFSKQRLSNEDIPGLFEGFAADAWLANWDVMGLTYDNMAIVKDGAAPEKAWRLDVGGALRYRAQGQPKPGFDGKVGELDTMRDPSKAREAGGIYKRMTPDQLDRSAAVVIRVSDDDIRAVVDKYGPHDEGTREKLAQTLIDRKNDIAKRFPGAAKYV